MVTGKTACALALVLLLGRGPAAARELADYRLGDRLEADVTTPFALKVVDMEASKALKEAEAMRVQVILRFDPTVLTDAEADLRDSFSLTRSNFIRSVERYFKKRKLDATAVTAPEFELMRATFQKANASFPVSSNLAVVWALGDSGRAQQAVVIDRLRESLRQPIRDPNAPARIKVTTRARLVTVTDRDEELTVESLGNRGKIIPRTNAIALDRARRDFIAKFPTEEMETAKFAARFLLPNCRLEEELTEQLRARRTEALWVLNEYAPNDPVGRRGDVVDARILAALQALVEKQAQAELKQSLQATALKAEVSQRRLEWLALAAAGTGLALVLITWQWWRRRRELSLLPVRAGDGALAATPEAAAWQRRALDAERQAERAHEALRAGVMQQVSNVLQEKLVHGLVNQRKELIEAQQAAAVEMADLEKRLNELQAPLQDRLRAYEGRIAELESALAAKDEQNRELIKAKIALVRQQLAAEQAKGQVLMN
jgi:hypothetical protein